MKIINALLIVATFSALGIAHFKDGSATAHYSPEELRKLYGSGDASKWPAPNLDPSIDKLRFKDIGVLPKPTYPQDNPFTQAKSKLGKILFFDPKLSQSGQISCANCHNPELGWTDNLTRSFGHDRQNGKRNAMTILNVAYATSLFWDGRATSLEHQAIFPIQDGLEMNEHLGVAVEKIATIAEYQKLFATAFEDQKVSIENIQKAIATFERSIISYPSKFDKFVGGNAAIFSDEEVLGMHVFRTKANCISCHNTSYFSDNQFHNDGQALFGTKDEDFGRYNVTGKKDDLGKFRTPTLREVGRTGPWMHHGHFPSLLDVVEFYNLGNPSPIQKKYLGTERDSLIPKASPILKKLNLTKQEINALIAFMNTLSTPTNRMKSPELPR